LWRHLHQTTDIPFAIANHLLATDHIHGYNDGASNDGQDEEDVPAHSREAEEDGRIKPYHVDQHVLLHAEGFYPGEQASAKSWRRVFLVGMAEAGRIDGSVPWSEDTENDGNKGSDA
jgi:hypothetical protein